MSNETLNEPSDVSVALATLAPGTTAGEVPTWTGSTWVNDGLSDYPVNIIANSTTALSVKATAGGNTILNVNTTGAAVDVKGDLTVYGNTTFVNTTNLSVDNSFIRLANGNPADVLDIGIYGKYISAGTHYSAFFRDASDSGKWKIANTDVEPNLTVSSFTLGTLELGTLTATTLTGTLSTASQPNITTLGGLTTIPTSISGVLKATAGVIAGASTTTDLTEGTNLYYTDARVRAAISGASGISYNSSTGAFILNTSYAPTFTSATLSNLTASRMVVTDASKLLASSNMTSWVAGTTDQITVTDDGDGSITLSTPQSINTTSSPSFTGLTISGLTASRMVVTNGSKALISSNLTGTTNQVTVSGLGGATTTLSLPQSIHTTGTPQFGSMGLGIASDGNWLLNASMNGSMTGVHRIVGSTATTSDTYALFMQTTFTGSGSYAVGAYIQPFFSIASGTRSTCAGICIQTRPDSNAGTISDIYGILFDGGGTGAGTISRAYGGYFTNPAHGTARCALYGDNLSIGVTGTSPPTNGALIKGNVQLNGSSSGSITLSSGATPTTYTLTLPSTAGTANYVMQTNGSGTATWVGGMTLISSTTLGGAASTISFSSIPATYTHLRVVLMGAFSYAGTSTELWMRFNSDTGSNYDRVYNRASASTNFVNSANQTAIYLGAGKAATGTSGANFITVIDIPFYAQTTFWKAINAQHSSMYVSSDTNTMFLQNIGANWKSTTAISSITFADYTNSSNFITGSCASLYGIM